MSPLKDPGDLLTLTAEELDDMRDNLKRLRVGCICSLTPSKYDRPDMRDIGQLVVSSVTTRPMGFVPLFVTVILADGSRRRLTAAQTRRLVPL